ncbi:MAG: PASTA domain-containing protein, partial [Ruminococcus sp.]|nr:PASTA domain-containing protein [Ruminococcus sp.]
MKFCMGCMEQYEDEYRICPRCGYIEGTKAENDIGIVPGSILADRYIVGKMLNWDDAHISYIGWDALAEKKVRLQELFVSGVCVRSEWNGRVEAINSDKAVIFGKYKNKLIELADKLTKVTGLEYIESIESYFEASNTVYIVSDYFETEELSKMMGSEKSISPKKLRKRFVPILSEIDKLHELGYFIGMIRERNIVVTRTGGFLLKEHIWACLESRTRPDTADGSLNEYTFPYEFVKDPESTLNSPSVDVYSIAAIMYRFATGADMSKADCLDRAASLKKKHKDNIKPIDKLTDSSDTADHVFSNAVMNAFNVYPDYRTPDMERFIEELTAEKPAERRRQYKKVTPLWAKILIPAAAVGAVTAGTLFVINMKMKTSAPELEVTVPGFQSKSIDEARKMAEKSNLKLIMNGKEYSKTDSENTVISQS